MPRFVVASLFCLAALGGACGGGTKRVGRPPAWRGPDKAAEPNRPESGTRPDRFAPTTPAATRYNDPPLAEAPSAPLADAIVAAIRDVAVASGTVAPRPDGRLYAAARELATVVPDSTSVPPRLIDFTLQRNGIIEPNPKVLVIRGGPDDPAAVVEQLREELSALVAEGPFDRIGVGSARRGEAVTVIVLQASHLTTNPIPRAVPAGGIIELRGELLPPFSDPEVFVTRDNGVVEQPQLAREGDRFVARIGCLKHRGRQQIEVTGIDATGSTVLANFPVWCNAKPPASISLAEDEQEAPVTSAEDAERRLYQLVNRDRAKYGLPALEIDPKVAAVARAHSKEMAETGVVAHVSPTTGSASDRIRAADIRAVAVLENVARAYGVNEAEDGLMNSPGHRANILSKQVTRLGIGVVVGEEVAEQRGLFVTQLFIHPVIDVSMAETRDYVRRAVARVGKLKPVTELSAVAQAYADDMVAGRSRQEMKERASKSLAELGKRFSRAATLATTMEATADGLKMFEPSTMLTDKTMTHFGVGVAEGVDPERGIRVMQVVVILAQ